MIKSSRRLVLLAILSSLVGAIVASGYVSAQQLQLSQEIKPYVCTYSTTQTGPAYVGDTQCQNQIIPSFTSLAPSDSTRPILQGRFQAARSLSLRVWFDEYWYKYGRDRQLSVRADTWTLDLSQNSLPLKAGSYSVIVEVETVDGLLLRNVGAGSFYVSAPLPEPNFASVMSTIFQSGGRIFSALTSAGFPSEQPSVSQPATNTLPQPATLPQAANDISQTEKQLPKGGYIRYVVSLILIGSAIVWLILRKRRK